MAIDEISELERELQYFERHIKEIGKKYNSDYVAVFGERIVDSDPNMCDLLVRCQQKYGDKVYIASAADYQAATV